MLAPFPARPGSPYASGAWAGRGRRRRRPQVLLWGHFLAAVPPPDRPRPPCPAPPPPQMLQRPILWWVSSLHHSPQSQMAAPAGREGKAADFGRFPGEDGGGELLLVPGHTPPPPVWGAQLRAGAPSPGTTRRLVQIWWPCRWVQYWGCGGGAGPSFSKPKEPPLGELRPRGDAPGGGRIPLG